MSAFLNDSITLERIILRRLTVLDASLFFDTIQKNNDFFDPFISSSSSFPTLSKVESFLNSVDKKFESREGVLYGMFLPSIKFIGTVDSLYMKPEHQKADIGYWLSEEYTGFGYMREAVVALEKELYNIGYRRFRILCDEQNERSANVAKKLGYELECLMKRERIMGGKPRNTLQFAKVFD